MSPASVVLPSDCLVTLIPEGRSAILRAGETVTVTQALGGTITVLTESGRLARVSALDAAALGLTGDAAGARDAADERDRGKADDLGAEQREGRNFFVVAEQEGPAHGAKDVAEVDAAGGERDTGPVGHGELSTEGGEIEMDAATPPNDERDEREED